MGDERMKTRSIWASMASGAVLAGLAISPAHAVDLILNGGFENGTQTVGSNTLVPVSWTPNTAFQNDPSYGRVVGANPHSGQYSLEIGNFDTASVDAVSQTFTDVVGATYTASYFAFASSPGDANAFLSVSINGTAMSTLADTVNAYPVHAFSFTFTGTGSDTLAISAATNPGDWYIDDVSVVAGATSPAPEPGTWALMVLGLAAIGALVRARRGVATAVA